VIIAVMLVVGVLCRCYERYWSGKYGRTQKGNAWSRYMSVRW